MAAPESLAFLRSVELAAVHAYVAAASSDIIGNEAREMLELVKAHHSVHADDLGVLLASSAADAPNPRLLEELLDRLAASADQAGYLAVFSEFELQLTATYNELMAGLDDEGAVESVSVIAPIEASHGVALGLLAGRRVTDLFGDGGLFSPAGSLAADRYPI